ncbi:MAG: DUF4386 domain-containing protein [Saonia sp.]
MKGNPESLTGLGNLFKKIDVYLNSNQSIEKEMTKRNKTARFAGLLYLILVISGIINLMYIPSKLIVWENPSETLENIIRSEMLFRLGILSGILTFLMFLLLPLALYKLLHHVNKKYAMLMVIFAIVSIPISFINILNKFSVLTLISKANYLNGLDASELQFQVMFYLDSYNNGIEISQIFWGLWLFPFGYLVYKSGFLPKFLGVLLMMGCIGYLITFLGGFLYPNFHKTIISTIIGLPASIGEIGICLWLLIMGARTLNFRKKTDNHI